MSGSHNGLGFGLNDLLAPMEFVDVEVAPVRIPVTVGKERFILTQADTGAAVKYRDATTRAIRFNSDGNLTAMDGGNIAEPLLVSMCLRHETADGQPGDLVKLEKVLAFVPEVTVKLVERIKAISPGLDQNMTEEALEKQIASLQKKLAEKRGEDKSLKNSPSATTN